MNINTDIYKDKLIDSLKKLISIPSVLDENDSNYPFGKNINDALNETLKLCTTLGFKTYRDENGYYGYAEIGQGEELIGILGHLDVVPAGELSNWKFPPFECTVHNEKLYGRGTQDDKGPLLSAIYGTKALMDSGFNFKKRVRFIFGVDEENLWRGINKYLEKEETPSVGFTPDSVFPLIYAEKGLLQATLSSKTNTNIFLDGGKALNAVPDKIIYSSEKIDELEKELKILNYNYSRKNDEIIIHGKSAHASTPQHGINAISRLCIALKNIGIESNTINFIANEIKETYNGELIIPNCEDDVSGKLTINIGRIFINSEKEELGMDIRIPVTIKKETVVNKIKEKASLYGLDYNEYDYLDSIYIPKDHFLIKTLRKVYEEETGLDSTPLTSGGATYARAIKNCVAFGAIFPDSAETEHQPNEYIEIKDLVKCMNIYSKAIFELAK
ncbi:peptidase [Tepiditoga spiralis]|uniref:Peptidase n=1 Tax=Tepiditoga spiralis TaxID=2108365 RepID=A0A7G1GBC5_9BACT|nr:M20 family metallopeptidase [Tepiditoga spiralis]BBE31682.1 peptidase [Tepiditoga spiralis]